MYYDKRNRAALAELAPNTKAAANKWYDYLVKNKIEVLVYDARRTEAEQRANVNSGASQTMKSYHLVGQALDFVPATSNGKVDWGGYGRADIKKAIAEAKRLGFEWGGDWSGFVDKPHLQYNYKGYGTDKTLSSSKPASKPPAKPSTSSNKPIVPYPGSPLYKGAKGMKRIDIERVQRAVGAKVTGSYDTQTARLVGQYQARHKLKADQVVGPRFWDTAF